MFPMDIKNATAMYIICEFTVSLICCVCVCNIILCVQYIGCNYHVCEMTACLHIVVKDALGCNCSKHTHRDNTHDKDKTQRYLR